MPYLCFFAINVDTTKIFVLHWLDSTHKNCLSVQTECKEFLCHQRQSESHHRFQNTVISLDLFLNVTNLKMTITSLTCIIVYGLCDLISTDLSNKCMSENSATVATFVASRAVWHAISCQGCFGLLWVGPPLLICKAIKFYPLFKWADLLNFKLTKMLTKVAHLAQSVLVQFSAFKPLKNALDPPHPRIVLEVHMKMYVASLARLPM